MTATRCIESIVVGVRHRRDHGDIDTLARSVTEIGLLHPIVIRLDGTLIAGERRLEACKRLGWSHVPVTIVDIDAIVRGEFAENSCRKDLTPSEMVAIAATVEERERDLAAQRMTLGKVCTGSVTGKTRDNVAAPLGVSGYTLEKAKAVVRAAEVAPDKFGHLVEEMDKTGKVDCAYRKLRQAEAEEQTIEVIPTQRGHCLREMPDTVRILQGDCRDVLLTLPSESVHCVVTSPPYFGHRDYRIGPDAFGHEPTRNLYVEHAVGFFREVRRVMLPDATLWLNLGDSFSNKQLLGIPWRVALALQDDGWLLRSEIIWSKTNPIPENVTDRPTKAHETIFLLAKNASYYYDAEAIAEPALYAGTVVPLGEKSFSIGQATGANVKKGGNALAESYTVKDTRNKRSVWQIATARFDGAHFATFPPALIEPCIKAGCPPGGTVLDPFFGAGTTGLVADRLGRNCIGIELNPDYAAMAHERICQDAGIRTSEPAE